MSLLRMSAVGSISEVGTLSVELSLVAVMALGGTPAIFAMRSTTGPVVISWERTCARATSGSNWRLRSPTDERGQSTRMCVSAVPFETERWLRLGGKTEILYASASATIAAKAVTATTARRRRQSWTRI